MLPDRHVQVPQPTVAARPTGGLRSLFILSTLAQLLLSVASFSACAATSAVPATATPGAGNDNRTYAPTEASSLIAAGDEAYQRSEVAQAVELYLDGVEAARQLKLEPELVEALSKAAEGFRELQLVDAGRELLLEASLHAQPNQPRAFASFLWAKGRFELDEQQLERARATFEQLHFHAGDNAIYERAVQAAQIVAVVCNALDQTEERIRWSQFAVATAERGQLSSWLSQLWTDLGWAYDRADRLDDMQSALTEARLHAQEGNDYMTLIAADWAVAYAERRRGAGRQAYDHQRALLARLMQQEREASTEQLQVWIGQVMRELGEYHVTLGNNGEALLWFQDAQKRYEKAPSVLIPLEWTQTLQSRISELTMTRH